MKRSLENYIKVNYAIDFIMEKFDTDGSRKELLDFIDKEKKVYRLRKVRKTSKLMIAASIILLISISFIFNRNDNRNSQPVIITNNDSIYVGTDKATLTLEDGASIPLKKGATYVGNNVNSTGKKLIYKNANNCKTEIVYHYLTIPRGGQYFLKLPDGTEVWLNSESQLKYPVSFKEGEAREVELVYGEAYFDVSPSTNHNGSKFKVLNNAQEIEVLGTEFNLKAYNDETNVYTTLIEGEVVVNTSTVKQILTPNHQSILNIQNNEVVVTHVDVNDVISWKNGVFSFRGKTLKDIMKVMSRWYDVDVIFMNKNFRISKIQRRIE